jgi:hypothetical protein
MSQYYISFIIMGQTPPKDLIMAKRRATPKTCAIRHGMWPCMIWKQSLNNYGNPFGGVQKPSQNDHLQINVTCVKMSTWRN